MAKKPDTRDDKPEKGQGSKVTVIAAIILIVAIAGVVAFGVLKSRPVEIEPVAESTPQPTPTPEIVIQEKEVIVENVIEVEREITSQIIEDGLENMGFLVTQKYFFTQVISEAKDVKLFETLHVPFTESSKVFSYDGVIYAGIDFEDIHVDKNDDTKVITVSMPEAEIQSIDIDFDSFVSYVDEQSIFNPFSAEEINAMLIALEQKALEKAGQNGIIESANENAENLIKSFISSMFDASEYSIEFKYA